MFIERHLSAAWRLVWEEPLFMLIGGLIVQVINVLSFGICTGPALGGYMLCLIWKLRDNRPLRLDNLLVGFSRFGPLFPYAVVPLLTVLGFIFFLVPGVIFLTWWLYTLQLMADRELPLATAMAASRQQVRETGFWSHLLFIAVITMLPNFVINAAMMVFPFVKVLQIVVMPFQCACLASLYVESFGEPHFLPNRRH